MIVLSKCCGRKRNWISAKGARKKEHCSTMPRCSPVEDHCRGDVPQRWRCVLVQLSREPDENRGYPAAASMILMKVFSFFLMLFCAVFARSTEPHLCRSGSRLTLDFGCGFVRLGPDLHYRAVACGFGLNDAGRPAARSSYRSETLRCRSGNAPRTAADREAVERCRRVGGGWPLDRAPRFHKGNVVLPPTHSTSISNGPPSPNVGVVMH